MLQFIEWRFRIVVQLYWSNPFNVVLHKEMETCWWLVVCVTYVAHLYVNVKCAAHAAVGAPSEAFRFTLEIKTNWELFHSLRTRRRSKLKQSNLLISGVMWMNGVWILLCIQLLVLGGADNNLREVVENRCLVLNNDGSLNMKRD